MATTGQNRLGWQTVSGRADEDLGMAGFTETETGFTETGAGITKIGFASEHIRTTSEHIDTNSKDRNQ